MAGGPDKCLSVRRPSLFAQWPCSVMTEWLEARERAEHGTDESASYIRAEDSAVLVFAQIPPRLSGRGVEKRIGGAFTPNFHGERRIRVEHHRGEHLCALALPPLQKDLDVSPHPMRAEEVPECFALERRDAGGHAIGSRQLERGARFERQVLLAAREKRGIFQALERSRLR